MSTVKRSGVVVQDHSKVPMALKRLGMVVQGQC